MNIRSDIWTPIPDNEDGEYRDGEITLEVADVDLIVLRFSVDGEQVAHASFGRFDAGVLVGTIAAVTKEALRS